ncbi:TPA: RNA 2',3'-cyclic phosphodiesterase [Patescibacteria group bacterium]|nr:RNA 2',3'-cyclic phosphodiesterase [Patescibacteria group bacterium]
MKQRLFVAINLDDTTTLSVGKIIAKLPDLPALRKTKLDNLHLTLQFLGDTEENLIPEIQALLDNLSSRSPAVKLEFTQLIGFPSWQQPQHLRLSVKNDSLKDLQANLAKKLIKIVPTLDGRTFQAHITLARVKSLDATTLNKIRFLDKTITLPSTMPATTIALMASTPTPAGSVYQLLSRHMLAQ